jgi:glyoxalase superfamily protein
MTARVGNITIDCADALVVGEFWSLALGRPLDRGGSSAWCAIGSSDAERAEPAWFFERVPEAKSAKNRMHVDLIDPDPKAVERLVGFGATVVADHQIGEGGHRWTVLRDPEGNEFCVSAQSYSG